MLKPTFRWSRKAAAATVLFLLSAVAVLCWVIYSATTNPGDSGESGILILPFAMPWISIVPSDWLGPWLGIGCILVNALLIYCLAGGLRLRRD